MNLNIWCLKMGADWGKEICWLLRINSYFVLCVCVSVGGVDPVHSRWAADEPPASGRCSSFGNRKWPRQDAQLGWGESLALTSAAEFTQSDRTYQLLLPVFIHSSVCLMTLRSNYLTTSWLKWVRWKRYCLFGVKDISTAAPVYTLMPCNNITGDPYKAGRDWYNKIWIQLRKNIDKY